MAPRGINFSERWESSIKSRLKSEYKKKTTLISSCFEYNSLQMKNENL
jgi:hypothetical protein